MSQDEAPRIMNRDGVTVLSLFSTYESLDDSRIIQLTELLLPLVEKADPPLAVIDLSQTIAFGTAFLSLLIRMRKRLVSRGGRLAITGLTPHCSEVIRATRLHVMWETFDTIDEAVVAFRKTSRFLPNASQ